MRITTYHSSINVSVTIPYLANLLLLCYTGEYEFIYRQTKILTQLPFELKLRMPNTDRGGRGYSDNYIEEIEMKLYN